jgi:ligand-binding sensor domain-containing protein
MACWALRIFAVRCGIVVLSLVLLAGQGDALDPHKPITHYSQSVWHTADGLPQDSVRAIAQTRDGYLWIGTQAGLARFDGVHFTIFDPSNSPLKHDHIMSLLGVRDGSLWIGTGNHGGLHHWTADTGFVNVAAGTTVRALLEDQAFLNAVNRAGSIVSVDLDPAGGLAEDRRDVRFA